MQNKELKSKIIRQICENEGVSTELVLKLLDLESKHRDLLAWGARPGLRRDIAAIMEEELESRRTE
ncbi:TPA: DNA modification system-associated small protein [Pseudomonas aeruginosa]|uniref:DNA modification system-associated small protein n=1 Tax=Pseudomonas aeruginosa TaxID=287 RepID=UPI001140F810|nr:DNA modification system-associated small protein [Pseudomonas aeruginosa]HCL2712672.1 hypothetical protein [Pseudomonas aeruginosa EF8E]MCV0153136.1 hypothetical protein [Pseudomonas aeruginosa]HBO4642598.1 hypothetical protein [Pseudomonas aeruginosa]HBP1220861.1 hypothetical protein [Pseudomonas aeruginosa]HCL2718872.1 hypothetical protein [Pseudomonas aeruginosa EF8E]